MGLTRAERIAGHKKQERLQVQKNVPSVIELSEGVPTLRSTPEGLVEYVRYNNQLYKKIYVPESTGGAATNPAFHVELTTSDQNVTDYTATVLFNDIKIDTVGGYDTSTGKYTVQKGSSGLYYLSASLTIADITDGQYFELRIVHNDAGTDRHYQQRIRIEATDANHGSTANSVILEVSESDYIYIEVHSNHQDYDVEEDDGGVTVPQTWFKGFKIN